MERPATRYLQRLDSYRRALSKLTELTEALSASSARTLFGSNDSGLNSEIAREALIKRFEYTQELSWKMLEDYLIYQGEADLSGSRDVYRRALRLNIIDSPLWMNMILDRNISAHDYNDIRVEEVADRIIKEYHPLFKELEREMTRRTSDIPQEDC